MRNLTIDVRRAGARGHGVRHRDDELPGVEQTGALVLAAAKNVAREDAACTRAAGSSAELLHTALTGSERYDAARAAFRVQTIARRPRCGREFYYREVFSFVAP